MELQFCSRYTARTITDAKPNHWHVISIGSSSEESKNKAGETEGWPSLPNAAEIHKADFDDVVYSPASEKKYNYVTPEIIEGMLVKARTWLKGNKAVLVHCHAGISRSTATTLSILLDQFKDEPDQVLLALYELAKISENIMPNPMVVLYGLQVIYKDTPQKAERVYRQVLEHRIWRKMQTGK